MGQRSMLQTCDTGYYWYYNVTADRYACSPCTATTLDLVECSKNRLLVDVNLSLHYNDSMRRFNLSLQNHTGLFLQRVQELPEIDIEVNECAPGYYCIPEQLLPIPCPRGTFNPEYKGESVEDCLVCPRHYFCPLGSASPLACPSGHFTSLNGSKDPSDCVPCSPGYYCPSDVPIACPAGTYQTLYGETSNQSCLPCPRAQYCLIASIVPFYCPAGTFQPTLAAQNITDCIICPIQSYCSEGSVSPIACPPGLYRSIEGATKNTDCKACPQGTYVVESKWHCLPCPVGYYCEKAIQIPCPMGFWQNETGKSQCKACENGTYSQSNASFCPVCPVGFFCNQEVGMRMCDNHTTSMEGAKIAFDCFCEPGYECAVLPVIIVSMYIETNGQDVARYIPGLQEWIIGGVLTQRPSEMIWIQ